MRCTATTRSGKQCGANSLHGKKRCLLHSSPGRARELGRRGGENGRRAGRPGELLLQMAVPQNAIDVRQLLGQSLSELRAGKLSATLAYAISSLATAFLRAADAGDMEERVARLEKLAEERKANGARPN